MNLLKYLGILFGNKNVDEEDRHSGSTPAEKLDSTSNEDGIKEPVETPPPFADEDPAPAAETNGLDSKKEEAADKEPEEFTIPGRVSLKDAAEETEFRFSSPSDNVPPRNEPLDLAADNETPRVEEPETGATEAEERVGPNLDNNAAGSVDESDSLDLTPDDDEVEFRDHDQSSASQETAKEESSSESIIIEELTPGAQRPMLLTRYPHPDKSRQTATTETKDAAAESGAINQLPDEADSKPLADEVVENQDLGKDAAAEQGPVDLDSAIETDAREASTVDESVDLDLELSDLDQTLDLNSDEGLDNSATVSKSSLPAPGDEKEESKARETAASVAEAAEDSDEPEVRDTTVNVSQAIDDAGKSETSVTDSTPKGETIEANIDHKAKDVTSRRAPLLTGTIGAGSVLGSDSVTPTPAPAGLSEDDIAPVESLTKDTLKDEETSFVESVEPSESKEETIDEYLESAEAGRGEAVSKDSGVVSKGLDETAPVTDEDRARGLDVADEEKVHGLDAGDDEELYLVLPDSESDENALPVDPVVDEPVLDVPEAPQPDVAVESDGSTQSLDHVESVHPANASTDESDHTSTDDSAPGKDEGSANTVESDDPVTSAEPESAPSHVTNSQQRSTGLGKLLREARENNGK